MTTHTDTGQLLTSVRDLLHEIETVLSHASPATHAEITTILASHAGNHGGIGMLIDQVQLTTLAIDNNLNNN